MLILLLILLAVSVVVTINIIAIGRLYNQIHVAHFQTRKAVATLIAELEKVIIAQAIKTRKEIQEVKTSQRAAKKDTNEIQAKVRKLTKRPIK